MSEPDPYDVLDAELNKHTGSMSKEVAFLTILAGAVYADNRELRQETTEVDALINRVRTLIAIPTSQRDAMRDEITPLVKDERTRHDRVRLACSGILEAERGKPPTQPPCPGLGRSVFAHACDVIYTDLEVTESEKTFLKDIARHLNVGPDLALQIVQIITMKNEY